MGRCLWYEDGTVICRSHSQSVFTMYNLHFTCYYMYVYRTYTRPLSVEVQYSRSYVIISSSRYNSNLVTLTVVCLTAAKFKPLKFPVSDFTLPNAAKICIFTILYDFRLLHFFVSVWVLCYDRRLIGQRILEWSTHLGLTTTFLLLLDSCEFVGMGLSPWEKTGLSFTIAAGPSQFSHSSARIPWDSRSYFTFSDFETRLTGLLRWRYGTPPLHGITSLSIKIFVLYYPRQTEYSTPTSRFQFLVSVVNDCLCVCYYGNIFTLGNDVIFCHGN
jgi:hypothetical protein